MRAEFAEAICSDPDSVLIVPGHDDRRRMFRVQEKLARLSALQLLSVERVIDAILTPQKQQEATDG